MDFSSFARTIVASTAFALLVAGCGGGSSSGSSASTGGQGGACGSASAGSRDLSGGGASFDLTIVNDNPNAQVSALHIVPWLDANDGTNLISGAPVPACTRFTVTLRCSNYVDTQRVLMAMSSGPSLADPAVDFACGSNPTYSTTP